MALTRKFLRELLADREDRDELIDQIIDMHVEAIAPLQAQLEELNAGESYFDRIIKEYVGEDGGIPAEAIAELVKAIRTAVGENFVKKSRYEAKAVEAEGRKSDDEWKAKHDALVAEFEAAKAEDAKREAYGEKAKAYRSLLLREGVDHSAVDIIVRGSGHIIDSMEVQGTVETAYHNGLREGLQGTPPQAEPNQDTFLSQMDGEDPEAKRMVGAALELVLTAYRSGRQIGAVQRDMHG